MGIISQRTNVTSMMTHIKSRATSVNQTRTFSERGKRGPGSTQNLGSATRFKTPFESTKGV